LPIPKVDGARSKPIAENDIKKWAVDLQSAARELICSGCATHCAGVCIVVILSGDTGAE
jgi:hypothetical protein